MTDNEKLKKIAEGRNCQHILICKECPIHNTCFGILGEYSLAYAKLMLERNELVAAIWGDDEKHTHEETLEMLEDMDEAYKLHGEEISRANEQNKEVTK